MVDFPRIHFFVVSAILSGFGFAGPALELPDLLPGQSESFKCSIYEREQGTEELVTGIELGVMRLVSVDGKTDFPFEAQYFITDEATKKHDLYFRDRFPSSVSLVRVTDLVVNKAEGDSDAEVLAANEEKESLKKFLSYFQLVAGLSADEPELYGYLLFVDVKGLSINVSFVTQEGKVLGHSGLLYGELRFACASPSVLEQVAKALPEVGAPAPEAPEQP